MAKLKATPKNFEQALLTLGVRDSVRLGNNTYLEVIGKDHDLVVEIGVRLHNTYIVRFGNDGAVTLHTGGWRTVTTKDRINEFITGRIYQKNHAWYYVGHEADGTLAWDRPEAFVEGMNVGQ